MRPEPSGSVSIGPSLWIMAHAVCLACSTLTQSPMARQPPLTWQGGERRRPLVRLCARRLASHPSGPNGRARGRGHVYRGRVQEQFTRLPDVELRAPPSDQAGLPTFWGRRLLRHAAQVRPLGSARRRRRRRVERRSTARPLHTDACVTHMGQLTTVVRVARVCVRICVRVCARSPAIRTQPPWALQSE